MTGTFLGTRNFIVSDAVCLPTDCLVQLVIGAL